MEHNHLHDHAAALPAQMPPESQLADVAELFKIFGDLTRVRIIFVLFQHEECVMDIAQKLEMTQSAISHQLRVLKQSRLVTSRREGKTIFYALADSHIPPFSDRLWNTFRNEETDSKAIPHKERLAILHAICLQIFRHISQKCS